MSRPADEVPTPLVPSGLLVYCFLALSGVAAGQNTSPLPMTPVEYYRLTAQAERYLASNEAGKAMELYERLVDYDPQSPDAWVQLGRSREALKRHVGAADAYQRALALGFGQPADVCYWIARAFALSGADDHALQWLTRALEAGFEGRPQIAEDTAFVSLRNAEAFRALAGELPKRDVDRATGWRNDFAYLVSEIKRLHYVYRSKPLPQGFEQAVRVLGTRVPQLTDEQITVQLQALMARLGDGHSVIYFFGGKRALKRLPLTFHLFSDGLYVVSARKDLKRWIGSRVVRIGDSDPVEVLNRLDPYISKDNPMFVKAIGPLYLSCPDFLAELKVASNTGQVPLTFANGDGRRETIMLQAAIPDSFRRHLTPSEAPGAPPAPRYLRSLSDNYWFETMPEHDTVYFQFNLVANAQGESLRDFALRLQRFLDEKNTQNLIVDVRHNYGGNADLLPALLRTLIHFDTMRADARLFVITSRSTFSAAQIFIAQMARLTNAVFAGEPSSSSPSFVGEDTLVLLPYSGTAGSISSRYHQYGLDRRIWIASDIPVALSSQAYFSNQDPVLDEVLRAINQ